MKTYREIREWLVSLLGATPKEFTSELDAAMQELWKRRDSVFGERRAIVHAFEAVLNYRQEEGRFTPHYLEQKERLQHLRQEISRRAQALKEYVERYVVEERDVLQVLGKIGAVITDSHIVYTSGKHGSAYVNKDAVYPHTAVTSRLCRAIAEQFADDNVQTVIAPAIGGVILSQWTAYHLSDMTGRNVMGVYAEKAPEGDEFVIKRGYDQFVKSHNVLVVEDVLNTGGSAHKVVDAVRAIGGNVLAVAALCNRGGVTPHDLGDAPDLFALVNVQMDAWDAADCPLCRENRPINTQVGKGREYLARLQ